MGCGASHPQTQRHLDFNAHIKQDVLSYMDIVVRMMEGSGADLHKDNAFTRRYNKLARKITDLSGVERKASYSKITVVSPSEEIIEPQDNQGPRTPRIRKSKSGVSDDETIGLLYRSGRAGSIGLATPVPCNGKSDGNLEDLIKISAELATAPVTSLEQVVVTIAKKTCWLMNCEKATLYIKTGQKLIAYVDRSTLSTNSLNPSVNKDMTTISKDISPLDPEGSCVHNMSAVYLDRSGSYRPADIAAVPTEETDTKVSMWMPIVHEGDVFACMLC
eukprot:TRINITY_DN3449_c0_g1_i4.p1 TRINITY_DN3449_c0_g1~~TRINITY_DN3449_c0_g1_i4.p1  ORF type:complete len:275 (+),score=85.02 TRINITY_DN3449_c0_g1_i4:325-1149(+)